MARLKAEARTKTRAERGGVRFSSWLLRPFLDLGPLVIGPLYARAIQEYWRAFFRAQSPSFQLQRTLPPAFRTQLIAETGRPEYRVSDPRTLPRKLRTVRWQTVCDALDRWPDLHAERQCRLVVLLHSLCLYQPALALVPAMARRTLRRDERNVKLAYWRASAQYALGLPKRTSDYVTADLSVFETIVRDAPDAIPEAFNSAVKIFVHKVKVGAQLRELGKWAEKVERALADAIPRVDAFTGDLLASRGYRALGFLPQRRGDRAAIVPTMDLAERHALSMKPATRAQELLYLENLHPLMESRTKEALWLGDRDLALARARKVVELDPYDSKAWVELGELRMLRKEWEHAAEAYAVAGMLGPPACAVGRYMAGVCLRQLGQDLLAAFFFKETLEFDPFGISSRDSISSLPDLAVLEALKKWSCRTEESYPAPVPPGVQSIS